MKCLTLFLMLTFLVMVGCSNENPFEAQSQDVSLDNASPAALTKKGAKKIEGRFETTFHLIPIACVDAGSMPVDCGAAGAIPVKFSAPVQGTGRVSHLGRSTVSVDQVFDVTVNPPTLVGTMIMTAANGDELQAASSGTATIPDAAGNGTFSGTLTFMGGTGRFRHASGSATFTGSANIQTLKGQFSFHGKITKQDNVDDD